jgi:hypothetical protein
VAERTQAGAAYFSREAIGERLGGFIYGTIVVISAVVAGAKIYPASPWHIAAFVVVTTLVFWLAHVYAHSLAESVSHDEHLSLAELRRIARREASIVEAGVPSIGALVLGGFGVLSEQAAIWLAVALGLCVLAVQGFLFARVERLRWAATLVVVTLNLGLGMLLIALKLLVSHH